jgi:periplasmic divalent cation tolerance protein
MGRILIYKSILIFIELNMSEKVKYILILSTCPGSISAKKIARDLVTEKLAACVNVVPGVQSFFSWVGKVDTANEHMMIIKTTLDLYDAVEKRLKKLHPYELPEIIAVPIKTGLAEYLDWISSNTKKL